MYVPGKKQGPGDLAQLPKYVDNDISSEVESGQPR